MCSEVSYKVTQGMFITGVVAVVVSAAYAHPREFLWVVDVVGEVVGYTALILLNLVAACVNVDRDPRDEGLRRGITKWVLLVDGLGMIAVAFMWAYSYTGGS